MIKLLRGGLTVDLILWKLYGRPGLALVETMLQQNPGLAELGPIIPFGTVVTIPSLPAETVTQGISLFD